jgi:misacylated tRNA(Ala) deacylase
VTEQRYLPDADDVTEFEASVSGTGEDYLVLDGTYFYPEGGGQPADRGELSWDGGTATVTKVRKNHGDVRHYVEDVSGELPEPGDAIEGRIDAERREAHRRMHTAQHVVSRVVLDEYGAETAGNQIHADRSRIDFEPVEFSEDDVERIERLSNEAIERDLAVTKAERPREEVEERTEEGRALLNLIPDHVDPLRVVEIEAFDYCPCGGTHVDSLGEVGRIEITNRESKGEATERIEFALAE